METTPTAGASGDSEPYGPPSPPSTSKYEIGADEGGVPPQTQNQWDFCEVTCTKMIRDFYLGPDYGHGIMEMTQEQIMALDGDTSPGLQNKLAVWEGCGLYVATTIDFTAPNAEKVLKTNLNAGLLIVGYRKVTPVNGLEYHSILFKGVYKGTSVFIYNDPGSGVVSFGTLSSLNLNRWGYGLLPKVYIK